MREAHCALSAKRQDKSLPRTPQLDSGYLDINCWPVDIVHPLELKGKSVITLSKPNKSISLYFFAFLASVTNKSCSEV